MSVGQQILTAYQQLFQTSGDNIGKSVELAIPRFAESLIVELCIDSIALLERTPTVVHVKPPVHIIGDLRGNLIDLIRIISSSNGPENTKFVFLGGYVNSGEFSLETIILLLALFCVTPDQIVLMRGMTETSQNCQNSRFYQEITDIYGPDSFVYRDLMRVFSYMPLVSVISKSIFCVYSGIGQKVQRLSTISTINRQIDNPFNHPFANDFLTACPSENLSPEASSCPTFTQENINFFLKANNFQFFIRAHECVPDGVVSFFEGKAISVFSDSTFNGAQNKSGFLFIGKDGAIVANVLPTGPVLLRSDAAFLDIADNRVSEGSNDFLFKLAFESLSTTEGVIPRRTFCSKPPKILAHTVYDPDEFLAVGIQGGG